MNLAVPKLVGYALAWGGCVGAVWFLFEKTEDTLHEDARSSIGSWLARLEVARFIREWPANFAEIFDSVFGRRHLSVRCLAASCLCSSFFSAVVFFVWKAEQPMIYQLYANQRGFMASAVGAMLLVMFVNWIPDYISLLESRHVIGLVRENRSTVWILVVLVADLAITFAIWVLGVYVYCVLGGFYVNAFPNWPFASMISLLVVPVVYVPEIVKAAVFFTSGRSRRPISSRCVSLH